MAKLIKNSQQKAKGAALAVSLILMVLLTSLAVTLVYNTSLDTKMASAYAVKGDATHRALGGIDEFMREMFTQSDLNVLLMNQTVASTAMTNTLAEVEAEPMSHRSTTCQHKKIASDVNISCNFYKITSKGLYGKQIGTSGNKSAVNAVSIIAVEVPVANN